MGPVVDNLQLDDVTVQKVHLNEEVHISDKHQVVNAPTILLLKDGLEIGRYRGVMPEHRLLKRIAEKLEEKDG